MEYSFDKSLGHLSQVISKNLGSNLEKKLIENGISLTAEQWSVISLVYHKKDLNQNAIANTYGFDKVRVLRILNVLEAEKIIYRTTDALDKRSRKVNISDKGVSLYHKIVPLAQETIDNALKSLTQEEVSQYMQLSGRIIQNLSSK